MIGKRVVGHWYATHKESGRNWLALGLLLAAWNFSDNDAVHVSTQRPVAFEKHVLVTVRAVRLSAN